MKKGAIFLLLFFTLNSNSYAAIWAKLNENNNSKLMLDKQSVLQQDAFKKAWVKIEYKTPQKNLETLGTEYNLSKLLWFFDCTSQKSATSQVFQYLDDELVYSAGVESKNAEFIEPVPESDVEIAMHHVCRTGKSAAAYLEVKPTTNTPAAKPEESAKKVENKPLPAVEKPTEPAAKTEAKPKTSASKAHWTYEGKEGPENWGKLNPEFATCDIGRNQSPINIENTMSASLKPLRGIQKFPAKDIVNNGHTVQVNFKEGNMLVLDSAAYQMKQVHFHAPSENTINGKSFPLEAHFVHADSKGNLTVIGVMFKEGKANLGLAKLWPQMPSIEGEPVVLKNRVTPSELIPENRNYYRFSGSLTTPPCSEGVRWILMKTPMTASKEQIEAFERVVKHRNNRPVQALNGRVVVE
ncbi:MAG: carbonic anhydrase family protein [Methylotenera sp.]